MNPGEEWVELAIEAARLGGKTLKGYIGAVDPVSIEAKRLGDWVSSADLASEAAIIKLLSRKAPGHEVLSEEAGLVRRDKPSELRWIIDPLDGTTNFLRGFPIWAVSVALEHRPETNVKWGQIVAGAIHIPPTGETFWATVGGGAYADGMKITVGNGRPLRDSLLATGFPFRTRDMIDEYIKLFADVFRRCAGVRRAGAVAVDLCYTARGIFDGFWELDLAPWDLAAGALIIREAGGMVGDFHGDDDFLTTGDIVAGHPTIYNELTGIVKGYFPTKRQVDKSPG